MWRGPCPPLFVLVAPCVRPRPVRAHPRSPAPLAFACGCNMLVLPFGVVPPGCAGRSWGHRPRFLPFWLHTRSLGRHGISLRENTEVCRDSCNEMADAPAACGGGCSSGQPLRIPAAHGPCPLRFCSAFPFPCLAMRESLVWSGCVARFSFLKTNKHP